MGFSLLSILPKKLNESKSYLLLRMDNLGLCWVALANIGVIAAVHAVIVWSNRRIASAKTTLKFKCRSAIACRARR
jgi:hypothetical protein